MCEGRDLRNAAGMAEGFGMKVGTWRDLARRRRFPRYELGHCVRWDFAEIAALVREEAPSRRR